VTVARDARDAGAAIHAARLERGLTQGRLAELAGVGRQWLVAVEQGHDRAELTKIVAVISALGMNLTFAPAAPAGPATRTWLTAPDLAHAVREELVRDDTNFALRLLARALAELRELADAADLEAFLAEPPSTGDHRWDTLIAASIGRACRQLGIPGPAWTNPGPLTSWWFPVFTPRMTARTIQRTTVDLASRGIWLDDSALRVA
jgi:y4mF family transcriptional regulator